MPRATYGMLRMMCRERDCRTCPMVNAHGWHYCSQEIPNRVDVDSVYLVMTHQIELPSAWRSGWHEEPKMNIKIINIGKRERAIQVWSHDGHRLLCSIREGDTIHVVDDHGVERTGVCGRVAPGGVTVWLKDDLNMFFRFSRLDYLMAIEDK